MIKVDTKLYDIPKNSKYSAILILFPGDSMIIRGSFRDIYTRVPLTLIGDGHAPATHYVLTQE